MKKIIKKILKKYGKLNTNLGSSAAQTLLADEIAIALNSSGTYKQYTEDELEKREAKKTWVCQTCGKSTFETDYDYLIHPKLHLGCALEEEMKGKGIKEQYHEASSRLYKDRLRN